MIGPLLFLLYINDLPVNIHDANLVMFADDINVLIQDSDEFDLKHSLYKISLTSAVWYNGGEGRGWINY